jgi:hypothetical protein
MPAQKGSNTMTMAAGNAHDISLTLIPPSPVTDKIDLDIRGAVWNHEGHRKRFEVTVYLDAVQPAMLLHRAELDLPAGGVQGVAFRHPTCAWRGSHTIVMQVVTGEQTWRREQPLEVIPSDTRSTRRIDGAWSGFYHWSETEGRLWNPELRLLTDAQWREQVRAMHAIGMNVIVIQELFRNEMYADRHTIDRDGYQGRAYYPSRLYPDRMPITAQDPLEAVLSEADSLGMHVFPGIGLYAWFDYSPGSLAWHKAVATELWDLYGHHPSFYGWYVSEEGPGSLGNWGEEDEATQARHRQQLIAFFDEFQPHCRRLAPDKPILLARNAWGVPKGVAAYPPLLKNVDILCPFAFHRMPAGDLTGEEAAGLLQRLCDESQAHLWMDMEAFLFTPDQALYPRPLEGLVDDLLRFPNFEKILCYQYQGLFNAPWSTIKPGGEATVELYRGYQRYRERLY